MINSPKVIKNIYEIISDSLIIVYSFIIIKNWTQKPGEHYFYIYNIYYYRYIIYLFIYLFQFV
jgi:hypothetical protein